ncbi:hypothetical protein [Streptomyces sp. NPDC047009]|uniref:hypothetical protein n=1 Tax=unclassified Streptomyces TaxID=2593676 RepID=UPI0033F01474
MTSGNGAERSGEEPAVGPIDGSLETSITEDSDDGEDTAVDPAPAASADRPREGRRKPGVEYRPV